jgi:hypothetical protein
MPGAFAADDAGVLLEGGDSDFFDDHLLCSLYSWL